MVSEAEKQVQRAMRWAQDSGQFHPPQLQNFYELTQMLQAKPVPTKHIMGGPKIDEGAFGSIEEAYYHGSKVAIKYIKTSNPHIQMGLAHSFHQLKLELQIVQTLRHPNIVDFIGSVMSFPEAGKKGDWFVGTMFECCEGGQLNRLLHKDNIKFTIAQKLKLMTDLSQGLSYLHGLKIIHRDLTSRNVLMSNGRAKICDFGCARRMMENSIRTTTISGSPPWMSPEQVKGEDLTLKADVYAIGVVFWEVMIERVPHKELGENATLDAYKEAIMNGLQPNLPSQMHVPDCPAPILQSFNSMLELMHQYHPDLRPTAEQVRRIMTGIAKRVVRCLLDVPIQGTATELLQELHDRMVLGNKVIDFYHKYNPAKLKNLSGVLANFVGKEEVLNEQMRLRYKADLNGEYPDMEVDPDAPKSMTEPTYYSSLDAMSPQNPLANVTCLDNMPLPETPSGENSLPTSTQKTFTRRVSSVGSGSSSSSKQPFVAMDSASYFNMPGVSGPGNPGNVHGLDPNFM